MMPDKIYLEEGHAEPIVGFVGPAWNNSKDLENPIEFIRKEALLEWLEQNRNQAQMWFDRYATHDDLAAKQVWEEVIGKLNEM